jgi:hypothetical protein
VSVADRVIGLPWPVLAAELDERGYATVSRLLAAEECADLVGRYEDATQFRSRVVMARHGYGRGEYQYFAHPLPELVGALRVALYPHLAAVANGWAERLGQDPPARFAPTLDGLQAACHAAGQTRPTPLLLRYGPDDYNCLHQDLYGDVVFPLQLTVLLSEPGAEFSGGEFVLTEQRPRRQSRVEVVPLDRGDAVIFAVRHRPALGPRGSHRVTMRHGVSRIRAGNRFSLGVIFHDAA